ncbi:MAG: F0F1 ATP synthase subunit delta [Tannerella sp.]|jgi:F-type H+-transporting ATPase subunit delta|nr:F0F1 ATP synthase subunit delta [Tannerella sp.]
MNEGLVSKRYAKALYRHAEDLGEETLLYHRMEILEALLRRVPDFKESMHSPMIADADKLALLLGATGKNAEQSYFDFINLVVTNERTEALLMITLSYQELYRRKKNISLVNLVSASKISAPAIARIRSIAENVTKGKVEFSNRIDPAIDGGFIFQINDLRIDASVRGQLDRIARRLARINKSII